MFSMWWLWVRNRRGGVIAALAALVAVLAVAIVMRGSSIAGVTFLGDAAAPPAAARDRVRPAGDHSFTGAVSLLDTRIPATAGPQTVAAAQVAWSAAELAERQGEVLAAYNCARQQQRLTPLTLDPALSAAAGTAWLKLVHDPTFTLMALPGPYAARGVLALDFSAPGQVAAQARPPLTRPPGAVRGCTAGGFDAATMPTPPASGAIGIAVFPPLAAWDSASAVVLVK